MVGYSEVVNVMAAMVLFSLILLTSNRMILLNSMKEVESEAEKAAINLAQDIIDEARVKPFDDDSDPTNFGLETGENETGSCGERRSKFDDFDDYHEFECLTDSWLGDDSFQVEIMVTYLTNPNVPFENGQTSPATDYKKLQITVKSDEYLTNGNDEPVPITMEYLRVRY